METQATTIAKLNDEFRREGFDFVFTRGVRALDEDEAVLKAIRSYSDFNEDNDPYDEHDFGSFEIQGEKLFWKIDYYNPELSGWRDPLDPSCNRIITIMLAEEY